MSYHQAFDRLGNPIARPARTPLGHRIVQIAGLVVSIVLLCMLYGGR